MIVSGPGQNLRARILEARRDFARQFLHHQRVAHQHGQRALDLPAFGVDRPADSGQIEGVGTSA